MHRCLDQVFDELSEALSVNQALEEWPDIAYVLATSGGCGVVQERREDLLLRAGSLSQLRAGDEVALSLLHVHETRRPERVEPVNGELVVDRLRSVRVKFVEHFLLNKIKYRFNALPSYLSIEPLYPI